MTNLPALVTQILLNCLHVAHLLLTKSSFRDRVRDGVLLLQCQDFGFWFVWYQDFKILSNEGNVTSRVEVFIFSGNLFVARRILVDLVKIALTVLVVSLLSFHFKLFAEQGIVFI